MNLEYIDRIQKALLRESDHGPRVDAPIELFEPLRPANRPTHVSNVSGHALTRTQNTVRVRIDQRVGTVAGAIAAAMLQAACGTATPLTALAAVAGITEGLYDDVFKAVAPRKHAITKNVLIKLLVEPGQVPNVPMRLPGYVPEKPLDPSEKGTEIASLRALACIMDVEFLLAPRDPHELRSECRNPASCEIVLRPIQPQRSFGGRPLHRWTIDVLGSEVVAAPLSGTREAG